jgi:thiamine-monophosphate kinase
MDDAHLTGPVPGRPGDRSETPASTWSEGPRVGDLGEFAVIDQLRAWIAQGTGRGTEGLALRDALLQVGPGDDAAVLRPRADRDLVWTCDIQIEGRHFLVDWLAPEEVGARAAQINLSDIAAMGAEPMAALISLGLPADLHLGALAGIYRGLNEALRRWGALIAGGNITRSERLMLDITMLGRVERGRALLRSRARAGDVVFVTGRPGRAAAALAMRDAGGALQACPADLRERLRVAYASPRARIETGRYLVENRIEAAVVDQSDGLTGDLEHICEESCVGIVLVEALLPVDPDLERLGAALSTDPLDWVLGASDDYELLCTVPRAAADRVFAIPGALGVPVTAIGEVVSEPKHVKVRTRAGAVRRGTAGWDHFTNAPIRRTTQEEEEG